jgi:hypothetical protein
LWVEIVKGNVCPACCTSTPLVQPGVGALRDLPGEATHDLGLVLAQQTSEVRVRPHHPSRPLHHEYRDRERVEVLTQIEARPLPVEVLGTPFAHAVSDAGIFDRIPFAQVLATVGTDRSHRPPVTRDAAS